MVVIGPGGAVVVEVKHWNAAKIRQPEGTDAAALLLEKTRRIATTLRRSDPNVPFITSAFLFTRESGSLRRNGKQLQHSLGVDSFGLKDADALLSGAIARGPLRADRLAAVLAPRQAAGAGPTPRRLARFDDLRLLSPAEDRFARVHSGRDPETGDRVLVYSYDLSAASPMEPADLVERRARREFEVVRRFQKSPFLPGLIDSWQPLPGQAGEMFFFSLSDAAAVPVRLRKDDPTWTTAARRVFSVRALRALAELAADEPPLIHRALDSETLRVRADDKPMFTGWRWARLPQAQTVAGPQSPLSSENSTAPEVASQGLSAATPASDVYSLCVVLLDLFDAAAIEVRAILSMGLETDPARRPGAAELAEALASDEVAQATPPLASPPLQVEPPAPVPASLWDEGYVFTWRDYRYRIVAVLGRGSAGKTFMLERLAGASDDPIGTFVGKAVINPEIGPASLNAYRRLIPHTRHDALSDVVECSAEWSPNELMALLRWAKGVPLDFWRGTIELLAEELGEAGPETLALHWFETLSGALDVLHTQGWVHGDVSAGNILVDEHRVVLIDYDLAAQVGTVQNSPGTALYASPERLAGAAAVPRDDLYALACSLFHTVTDRPPTREGNHLGLPWTETERAVMPRLVALLDAAASLDPNLRFENAGAALRRLRSETLQSEGSISGMPIFLAPEPSPLRPNIVERVTDILRCYPGSRFGNVETRGLDSLFAAGTYVETGLDAILVDDIQSGAVSLVILCGNAGDGKTAFLQHLTEQLGATPPHSSQRVWDGVVGGRAVKINLDGAASWQGRSADDLLDEIFEPFLQGPPENACVHLVAVNDGRLLEWIDHAQGLEGGPLPLTEQLIEALGKGSVALPPYIRLIELNARSLVGGIIPREERISSEFIDTLVDRLVGSEDARVTWQPCKTCTAQARCPMKRSADMMGASDDPQVLAQGTLMRRRLTEALQAVHQRNEVHITARELKAALSYILFGLHACEDLHKHPDLKLHHPADHAFDPESPARQGELLRELARLDPALEANARIDRYLSGRGAPDPKHGAARFRDESGALFSLASSRRRAWFEWSDDQILAVGGETNSLTFKEGRRSTEFRDFPLLPTDKKEDIKRRLCLGLSKLEALPDAAFRHARVVPVLIVPRTPTDTAFWIEKPLYRFDIEAERFQSSKGLVTLHRYLTLSFSPAQGPVEQLTIPLELYSLLMDLADGVQILDAFSDDVFANLGVFTQRLAQEDERSVRAWNPADDDIVYDMSVERKDSRQVIVLRQEPT
jgi:hypothetical protein